MLLFFLFSLISSFSFSEGEWDLGIKVYMDLSLSQESDLYKLGLDSACGKYLTIKSSNMPVESKHFDITWIYELNQDGSVLNKWPIPNDVIPVSISGTVLTVSTRNENQPYIDIDVNHKVKLSFKSDIVSSVKDWVKCPGEKYSRDDCAKIEDVGGDIRLITMFPTCT